MPGGADESDLVLEPLGLTPNEERVYRLLIREPARPLSEMARTLGLTSERIREAAMALEAKGLVGHTTRKGGGWVVASAPDLAVDALFARRQQELDRARELGKRLIERIGASPPEGLVDAITVVGAHDAYQRQCFHLNSTVRKNLLIFDKPIGRVASPELNNSQLARMEEGVTYRTIYEGSTLNEPLLANARVYVEAGEEARVVEELPIAMMIADGELALLPIQTPEDGKVRGAVIVRSPGLVHGLTQFFEAVWHGALPFMTDEHLGPSDELSDTDRNILAMMVSGLKDEAIARQLDVDPSTVRRRIKAMLERLGARTRFQAGIAAAKSGWLGRLTSGTSNR